MQAWIIILGFFGTIGLLFGTYHARHVIEHATHSMFLSIVVLVLGLYMAYTIAEPLYHQRWSLNESELWLHLVFGTIGIGVLLFELGHWLHDFPVVARIVGVGGVLLLLGLWLTKPGNKADLIAKTDETEDEEADTATPIEDDGQDEPSEDVATTGGSSGSRNGLSGPPIPKEEVPDMFLPE